MAENEKKGREEVFSRVVRAGRRTYFFDVKSTKSDEYYLTITESKRRFSGEEGKFFYEKHKLFLFKEDFDNFANALNTSVKFILTGEVDEEDTDTATEKKESNADSTPDAYSDIEFEDLGEGNEGGKSDENQEKDAKADDSKEID